MLDFWCIISPLNFGGPGNQRGRCRHFGFLSFAEEWSFQRWTPLWCSVGADGRSLGNSFMLMFYRTFQHLRKTWVGWSGVVVIFLWSRDGCMTWCHQKDRKFLWDGFFMTLLICGQEDFKFLHPEKKTGQMWKTWNWLEIYIWWSPHSWNNQILGFFVGLIVSSYTHLKF